MKNKYPIVIENTEKNSLEVTVKETECPRFVECINEYLEIWRDHETDEVYGFEIVAVFDSNPKKIGKKIGDINIKDVAKLSQMKGKKVDLGIIAIPRQSAQEVADSLVKSGINGILNFSPCRINVPKKVKLITIDIAMDLARLPYYMPAN